MSEIRVNNITNRDGSTGTTVAGIPVVDSTSHFVVPTGRTGTRYADGGENIVRDGLVLHLDAKYSYPSKTGITATTDSLDPDVYTWYDMSGNESHGQLVNLVGYNASNGGSLVFDGVNDYVDSGSITTGGKITVNAWVKITTGARNQHIVDSSSNRWHLAILGDDRPYFWNGSAYHTAAQVLSTSTWYMLTGVQSSTLDIYVNGVLSQSLSSNINVTTNNVNIGRWQSGSRPFSGNIAQVSIYNRALTASEVLQNYNALKGRFGL